ncbi:sigma-70 family RNA polymerase sigma factor [Ornithinibacillus gellani]|nr:sigma-70 family RNA polymerase sigma factor [Ornithinibacillus gellani]
MEQHGEELTRLAYLYVKNRAVAEDIIQDVFMKAFEQIHQFRQQSTYKTYLYRMTINRCHDYFRSWSYRNMILTDKITGIFSKGNEPEETAIKLDQKEALGQAILKLPVLYREVIILYYYEDFSVDEIAQLLRCSSNTVKTRMRRARIKLKTLWTGLEGGMHNG